MRNRALKWAVAVLAGVVVLAVVCGLLIRLLFDPNDHRSAIEAAFAERTGRELRLEGDLELTVLPWIAVRTGAVSIGNPAGFRGGPFLTLQDARFGLKLWPLLRRRVEFGRVVLERPVVDLRVDDRGRNNWSDLLQPKPAEPDDGAAPDGAVDFSVAGLAIEQGTLRYTDRRSNRRLRLEELDVGTGRLPVAGSAPVRVGFLLLSADVPKLRARLDGRVAPDGSRRWVIEDVETELELPRDVPGEAIGSAPLVARLEAPAVHADLGAGSYAAPKVRYAVGSAQGDATLEGATGNRGFSLRGTIALERTNLRTLMAELGRPLPTARDPKTLTSLQLNAALGWSNGLELRDLRASLDDTKLTGTVSWGAGAGNAVRFDLSGDRIDVDRYLAPAGQASTASRGTPAVSGFAAVAGSFAPLARAVAQSPPSPAGSALTRLDLQGKLAFTTLRLAGFDLNGLTSRVELRDGRLRLDPLRARVFGGETLTTLDYDLAASPARLTIDERLTNVDAAAVLGRFVKQRRLTGRGTLTAKMTARGASAKAITGSLAGPFELNVVDGEFSGVDLWGEIERAVALARGQSPPPASAAPHTDFDRFDAAGRVQGQRLVNDRFNFETSFARARGKGTVEFASGALDLRLTARLLRVPEGDVRGISLDQAVGVDIPVTVRGTLTAPKVRPDVAGLLKSAAKEALHEEGEKVKKDLEEKLKDKLKDLFGQ